MSFKGKGVYHRGPGGIEQPGDFGYRLDGDQSIEFVMYCPRFGVCYTKIHRATADASLAIWEWDGNFESPTIIPSIGCDIAPRCGQHVTIINGQIIGRKP
jgi:Family of unknown function (DUF6527)